MRGVDFRSDAESRWRIVVADLEITKDDTGGIPALIRHDPLLQRDGVGAEIERDLPIIRVIGVLRRHGGQAAVNLAVRDDHFRAGQIDLGGEDQVQRRAFQRILFRRLVRLAIENGDLPGACEDKGLVGRCIFEAHPVRAADQQTALGGGAVGVELREGGFGSGDGVEICRDVSQRNFGRRGGEGEEDEERGHKAGETDHGGNIGATRGGGEAGGDQQAERS